MGTGIGHYIPLIAYLGFWVMCIVSLTGRPLLGLYWMMPFIPYRTMRDKLVDYPLGGNLLTILVMAVIVGALIKGKRLPKSKLYLLWLGFAVYLYFSMWIGAALGSEPPPLWLSDQNFMAWKDYMLIPLLFVAASLVIEDRKAIRNIIILTTFSVFMVDRSSLLESLSRSWSTFDESKRDPGPLAYGSNQLGAFLSQFAIFFWGCAQFIKRRKFKLLFYGMVALTAITDMYTFSRGAYLALVAGAILLGMLKDRKLLLVVAVFLFTWQTIVPTAVTERVSMTENSNGHLEASAQERVDLWTQARDMFVSSPIIGTGFASFQYGEHTSNLKDTHNWYVKVLVETGVIGGAFACLILSSMVGAGYGLFRHAKDPLYQGLGLGFLLAVCSSMIANLFGDRWTYIEITGLLWILTGATLRARQLTELAASAVPLLQPATVPALAPLQMPPHMQWR